MRMSQWVGLGIGFGLAMASSAQTIAPGAPTDSRPPAATAKEPKSAADWFRRADELTNIRMPGSQPFHMKVMFHAYPGMDFTEPGKSPIMTGDGTYEEWWRSPKQWRREVSFGSYHAIEVFDEVRKFQATSDYEPSRVLMLFRALLYPIPRYLIEPELEDEPLQLRLEHPHHWKVQHLTAGRLAYIHLAWRGDDPPHFSDAMTWDLLPNGLPVRLIDRFGLVTSWQDQTAFGGRAGPGHLAVQAVGRDLVTASATVEKLESPDPALFHLPGDRAPACMTLRPFDMWDMPVWGDHAIHIDTPKLPWDLMPAAGIEILTTGVVDRQGIPREPEITGIYQDQRWLTNEEKGAVATAARSMVESFSRNRFRPALLDDSPCEVTTDTVLGRPTIVFWGTGGR